MKHLLLSITALMLLPLWSQPVWSYSNTDSCMHTCVKWAYQTSKDLQSFDSATQSCRTQCPMTPPADNHENNKRIYEKLTHCRGAAGQAYSRCMGAETSKERQQHCYKSEFAPQFFICFDLDEDD